MCSIVGLQGKFKGNDLIKLLKDTKNRGPDSTGMLLDDELFLDIDLDDCNDGEYSLGLGQNLLSIFNLGEAESNYQPITNGKLTLVFNGEIYNFKSLANFIRKVHLDEEITTDSYLILRIIEYYYSKESDLLESVKNTLKLLDGDYSFAVWDGENLAIGRDPLGVKPMFYAISDELNGFSSSKYALKQLNFENIETLKPGHILYNWTSTAALDNIAQKQIPIIGDISKQLETKLKLAVLKRVLYLDEVSVIFSGGVDSTLLTLLLKEIAKNKPLKIKLYSVGGENSKDVIASKKLAELLDLPLKIQPITKEIVKENLETVVKLIGENNLMKIGVGMTIYLACKMIHEDSGKVAISGQGADELFAGYNRYLKSYESGKLDEELRHDIENMYHVNLERDDAVSMANGVELRLPFLDKNLVEFALNIPVEYKISNKEDKIRKNILRDLASELGLPDEFAYRAKKAAQYGTGIDKILRKKVLKEVEINNYLK
ncbi:MAG: asparagine synthetase B [Methanobrevibacter sp.]|uniref:asparagine synthetase B n=1 Tax=Methanobrevibacter sp. TaxID=66852 RepID=UPI0026DF7269|nr:asparagine synthetase B [Methanobrevibacter sp.]MDO5849175.1 asparagine synthetase B [Methanobrevibacter sp.]